MAKPGPAKGSGGRPRKRNKPRPGDGYRRITVGEKGKGTQTYEHRARKGLKKGDARVVDHKDRKGSNNAASNLRVTTKAANTARSNRARAR